MLVTRFIQMPFVKTRGRRETRCWPRFFWPAPHGAPESGRLGRYMAVRTWESSFLPGWLVTLPVT